MAETRFDLPDASSPEFGRRVRETLMTYLGKVGNELDRGITLRDLTGLGLVEVTAGTGGQSLTTGPAIPSFPTGSTDPDLSPPPTPGNFVLTAGINHIFLDTDAPVFTQGHGYDRTIIYGVTRNAGDPAPTFYEAKKLGDFQGQTYAFPSDPATTWHMWVTWRSVDGVESVTPAGGVHGLEATTGLDVGKLLEALSGEITASQLNQDLSAQIDDSTSGVKYLATQNGLRVQVAADGKKLVGGFGIVGYNDETHGATIDFGVLASRFWVGAPSDGNSVSSVQPFVIQTVPITINGVDVPVGVYMSDAFIKNGTITNAKIANLAVDDAKIASLSVSKLTAGSLSVGAYAQSSNFLSGYQGWRITGDGNAEFHGVFVRGTVVASAGSIGGVAIDGSSIRTQVGFDYGVGFFLGADGRFSLGNAYGQKLTWNGYQLAFSGDLQAAGGTFKGALQAASGTFGGALTAATGTFAGRLTADAVDAVTTINIAGNAVTVPAFNAPQTITEGVGWPSFAVVAQASIYLDQAGWVFAMTSGYLSYGSGWRMAETRLLINGQQVSGGGSDSAWVSAAHAGGIYLSGPGYVTAQLLFSANPGARIANPTVFLMGAKR